MLISSLRYSGFSDSQSAFYELSVNQVYVNAYIALSRFGDRKCKVNEYSRSKLPISFATWIG